MFNIRSLWLYAFYFIIIIIIIIIFWFFFSELGTEPRALRFLGKRSTNPE